MSKIRTGVIYAAVGAVVLAGAATIDAQKGPQNDRQPTLEEKSGPRSLSIVGPEAQSLFPAGPQIGVTIRDVENEDVARLKLPGPGGVLVEAVRQESPAAKAGVKPGDVIVEFDGERVKSSRGLTRLVTESPEGRAVRMAVIRDGRRAELTVTPQAPAQPGLALGVPPDVDLRALDELGPRLKRRLRVVPRGDRRSFSFTLPELDELRLLPESGGGPLAFGFSEGGQGRLGIRVQAVEGQLARYFGVEAGVLVVDVTDGSPAAKAGVKAGDILTAVNGKAARTVDELVGEVRRVDAGGEVVLALTRDRKAMTLSARLDKPEPPSRVARPGRPA